MKMLTELVLPLQPSLDLHPFFSDVELVLESSDTVSAMAGRAAMAPATAAARRSLVVVFIFFFGSVMFGYVYV